MRSERLYSERIVRSYELDSFGHVNNAVYLQYCEGARNDYMLQRGIAFHDFHEWGIFPVLYRSELDYKQQARADDRLSISGVIEFNGKTRFTINHDILRLTDNTVICIARLYFAFINRTNQRPCRAPAAFVEAFTQ